MAAAASPFGNVVVPPWSERVRKIAKATVILARDPNRLDQVLEFILAVNIGRLARLMPTLGVDEKGRRMLETRPRIDRKSVDWAALERLPDGTLGREYTRFLKANGISPEPFESGPDVGDERVSYVLLRLRQTHDLWHVVTGYSADVRGELLLQSFTYGQLGAPSAAIIAVLGSLRYARHLPGHVRGLREAHRRGKASELFATFPWEEHWTDSVASVRAKLRVPPLSDAADPASVPAAAPAGATRSASLATHP